VEVVRNPHYWGAKEVKLNGVRFYPLDNLTAEERMFRDGKLHITEFLPMDKIAWWRDQQPTIFRSDPELSIYFYRLNTTRPPFNDKRVRRALALAIDRDSIVKNVARGGQPVANSLVPPHLGYKGPAVCVTRPDEARRLLAEAGFPQGNAFPERKILFNTMDQHRAIAESIQELWQKELGIKVGLNNQDWQVYLDSQVKLDYDVCRAGWTGDYVDPMTFLAMWTTGNGQNQTGWGNEKYDALIHQAKLEADPAKRLTLCLEAETLWLDELPAIPLFYRVNTFLVHPDVTGWPKKLLNNHPYQFVDLISEAARR
jgi:oligopeptide transport system substrate-binding protein